MVVRPNDAVREINRALSIVRGQLDEGARRVTAETGLTASAALKADPVLRSFHRASRQLSKLKACLLLQDELPLEYYWEQERDVKVTEEGHKAQTSILRAQQTAHERYQTSMAHLNSTTGTSTAHHGRAMELLEYCHQASTAASSALNAVVSALADFPVPAPVPIPIITGARGARGAGGAGGVDGADGAGGGAADGGRNLREHRHTMLSTRAQSERLSERLSERKVLSVTEASNCAGNVASRGGGLQRRSSSRACRSQRAVSTIRTGSLATSSDRRARTGGSLPRSAFSSSVADMAMMGVPDSREMALPANVIPLERDGKVIRHSAAVTYEERRVKSRAAGARLEDAARTRNGLDHTRDSGKNGKLSPEELRASSPSSRSRRPRHGGSTSSSLARWSNGVGKGGMDVSGVDLSRLAVERRQPGNHVLRRGRVFSAPNREISEGLGRSLLPNDAHGGPDSAAGGTRPAPTDGHRLHRMSRARAVREPLGDELERTAVSEAALAILLSTAATSPLSETHRSRRRGLIDNRSPPSFNARRDRTEPEAIPRLLRRPVPVREAAESSPEYRGIFGSASAEIVSPDVGDDEATAQRIAHQEMEAQAREDAMLALRLTALEEAGQERERRRARRRSRRYAQMAMVDPATAAAVASEGDVSEAVRVLQFQEIDENDFEVLLELDNDGAERGAGLCGKGRGLSGEAIEAALESETACGARLSERCVICMSDYEPGDEVSVLPCKHAFHSGCIRKWLAVRNSCPADMQPVVHEEQGS